MDTQPKQSRSQNRTAGARESKSFAHNLNRDARGDPPPLPGMTSENTSLAPRDGPSEELIERCTELRRKGLTIPQVAKALGLPVETLYGLRQEQPDALDGMETGFSDYVEQLAEETLQLSDQLPKIRGLRPADKLIAGKIRINTRLRVAEARLPNWRRREEGGGPTLLQVYLSGGVIKTTGLPGTPDGQNALALKAGRWPQLLPQEEHDRPGDKDSPGAGGPQKRAHRTARALPKPRREKQGRGAEET